MSDLSRYAPGKYARSISAREYREYLQSQILLIHKRSQEDTKNVLKSLVSKQTGVPETYISVEFARDEVLVSIRPPEPVRTGEVYFLLEGKP